MKHHRKPESFLVHPTFPGGNEAMDAFVSEHLQYPEEAIQNKVSGTVTVKYDIDHRGHVIRTKVLHGIGHGCDEEAERVIKLMKFQLPRNYNKMKVTFHKTTHIHFRLPTEPAPAAENSLQVNYIYTRK